MALTNELSEIEPNFISLDLRPSNICNFKCRTCNDGFSTKWQEEKEDFYKINENVLYFGKEKLSGVNKVNFKLNEDSMKNIEVFGITWIKRCSQDWPVNT